MTRLGIYLVVVSLALVSPSGNAAGQHAARHRLIGSGELIVPDGRGRWQGYTSELSPEQRATLGSDITVAEYARVHAALDAYERTYGLPPATKTDISTRYPFYPQAGVHEGDLFFSGFVDLDPTQGDAAILDWNCTDYTYDGHQGHDSDVRSFAFQDIGVPIYAALDGRVVAAQDGNPDRSTTLTYKPANYVIISHGGGQLSLYWHMRKGSVAVKMGDDVVAGQSIGMTASSGYSTGPHLHFETWVNRVTTEPFAGRCNPGASGFVKQLKFKRNTYLFDAGITHQELRTLPEDKLPPEQLPSSGQFQTDDEWLYIWFLLQNLPANSIQRVVFRRPNNSVALDTGARELGNIDSLHYSWWRQRWIVNGMRVFTGTWKLELHVNGKKLATMPYEVMTKRDADLNRAPVALKRVRFRNKPKAHRVPLCELKYPLVTDDPDYDVVSYRYVWKVDGRVVRDVTIAAHSDALATDLFTKGDRLECTVTPTDGAIQAASKSVRSKVR